jgi:hypothetical protein
MEGANLHYSVNCDDGVVRVLVVAAESSPLHEELMRVRYAKDIRRVFRAVAR